MRVAVYATKSYDRQFQESANTAFGHALTFLEPRLHGAVLTRMC